MELTRADKLKYLKKILGWSKRRGTCLICYCGLDKNGYSRISIRDERYRTARFIMYLISDFDLTSDSLIIHNDSVCSSKACIEFDHLRVGTESENRSDWRQKYPINSSGVRVCKRGHEMISSNITTWGKCKECYHLYDETRKKKRG